MRQGKSDASYERGFVHRSMPLQSREKIKSMEVCFYGAACVRPNCAYKHEQGKGSQNNAQVEPCRLDLAGLCYATAETCKKRHLVGDDRIRLIHNMSRTPCRFGLECRTKNCLYKHPQAPIDEVPLSSEGSVNPQQATGSSTGVSANRSAPIARSSHPASVSHHNTHASYSAPMPTAQYQWPPTAYGYHVMPYYHHPSLFMGMAAPPMYYDSNGYPLPAQAADFLPNPLYFPNAGRSGYPRSVSIPSNGGEEDVGTAPCVPPEAPLESYDLPGVDVDRYSPNLPSAFVVDSDASYDGESSNNEPSTATCEFVEAATSALPLESSGSR